MTGEAKTLGTETGADLFLDVKFLQYKFYYHASLVKMSAEENKAKKNCLHWQKET